MVGVVEMLCRACACYQDIGAYDATKLTDTTGTFDDGDASNENAGAWDTSKLTDMTGTFDDGATFNQAIGGWNTSHQHGPDHR